MGSLTLTERIARGREAIVRARAEGRDTRDWEAHLAKLEALAAGEGAGRPQGPFPATVADLLSLWATWPAPRSRWPRGERGPMRPPAW
jgi:hypothetical protein